MRKGKWLGWLGAVAVIVLLVAQQVELLFGSDLFPHVGGEDDHQNYNS